MVSELTSELSLLTTHYIGFVLIHPKDNAGMSMIIKIF